MGKEARIGLVVVGVLAGALLGLLIKRFLLTGPALMDSPAEHMASQPHAIPTDERPTVVAAQKDRGAAERDRGEWAENPRPDSGSDVPHGSFLPADEPAVNPRYAQQDQPTPAAEEGVAPTPESDPFHSRFAADAPAQAPAGEAPTPNPLDVAPEGAAALDARKPARSTRNPLRRLSAEVPLEETPKEDDASPAEPTIPDPNADAATDDQTSAAQPATAEPAADDALSFEPAAPQGAADRAALEDSFDQSLSDANDPAAGAATAEATGNDEQLTVSAEPPVAQPSPRQFQPARTAEAPLPGPAAASRPADGRYVIQPNDSLWTISQKVYGDGRYYQAIAEHNRGRMPHPDRLTAGAILDVPPVSTLEQSYPSLCPRQRRSALVKSRTAVPVAASEAAPVSGADVYVVAEGDTLFDIARYELGKAARWGEIYALNRDKLGEDFDFLQPGLELRMPPRAAAAAEVSQQTDRYQR
ncbi:MAG: LysM peptidoglycan-binding domain-containing protein [Pirellulales bacterium]